MYIYKIYIKNENTAEAAEKRSYFSPEGHYRTSQQGQFWNLMRHKSRIQNRAADCHRFDVGKKSTDKYLYLEWAFQSLFQ